jgi:hypothetical protein
MIGLVALVAITLAAPVPAAEHRGCQCPDSHRQLTGLVELARGAGFTIDQDEVASWLQAMQSRDIYDLGVDQETGTVGLKLALLELAGDQEVVQLARSVTAITRPDATASPFLTRDAIALSGSTAQPRIQSYPGDLDLLDRLVISAPSRAEAVSALEAIVAELALRRAPVDGFDYELVEVKLGSDRSDRPISWSRAEVAAGSKQVGDELVAWNDPELRHRFVKVDWIIVRRADGLLINASTVIDPIWKRDDGALRSLDTEIDSFFQEVYLDAAAEQVELLREVHDALDQGAETRYAAVMQAEVDRYLGRQSYGKAAKRLYNLTRARCRLLDAAYIGELLDEPVNLVYQVASRLKGIEESVTLTSLGRQPGVRMLRRLIDDLEGSGLEAADLEQLLLRLRSAEEELTGGGNQWQNELAAARAICTQMVNAWFAPRLNANPCLTPLVLTQDDAGVDGRGSAGRNVGCSGCGQQNHCHGSQHTGGVGQLDSVDHALEEPGPGNRSTDSKQHTDS